MTSGHGVRAVRALKVYCPIDREALAPLMRGELPTAAQAGAFTAIIDLIRADNPLGDFGIYRSVIELTTGLESFTPGPDARPTLGEAGTAALSPTAILTVYIPSDAPQAAVDRAIDAILAAHPWEVPVIELSGTVLITRA
ncbi:MAG: hypothetical protein CMN74_01005 [Sphingorhabdus sp.]|nr:hypothetical protein [Sphingorhabdus sp.]